jgi:hypothetical protein
MKYTWHALSVEMDNPDTKESTVSYAGQLVDAGSYCLPALVGLLMVMWGIFLDSGDWTLVIIGLALFLGFGYYAFRILTGKAGP